MNSILENVNVEVINNIKLNSLSSLDDNDNVKKIVLLLVNNSNALKDIQHTIQLIIEDNKITVSDINLFITLIKKIINLHKSDVNIMNDITYINSLSIIKYLFIILIDNELIKIDKSDVFLDQLNLIINELIKGEEIIKRNCFCY